MRRQSLTKRHAFTLIERTPSKAHEYWLGASPNSATFPFRADSLTLRPRRATGVWDGVTMSREGKPPVMVDGGLSLRHSVETRSERMAGHLRRGSPATRSQSERPGKRTGRRLTNDRKHRKATPSANCWQSWGRRRVASLCSIGEARSLWASKWEDAPTGPAGVKGDGMCGRIRDVNSGESLHGSATGRIKIGISDGESRPDAVQEVGDGHSTCDLEDNRPFREERAIGLERLRRKEVLA